MAPRFMRHLAGQSPFKRRVETTKLSQPLYRFILSKWASLVSQIVRNLSAMLETQAQSLREEDPTISKSVCTVLLLVVLSSC